MTGKPRPAWPCLWAPEGRREDVIGAIMQGKKAQARTGSVRQCGREGRSERSWPGRLEFAIPRTPGFAGQQLDRGTGGTILIALRRWTRSSTGTEGSSPGGNKKQDHVGHTDHGLQSIPAPPGWTGRECGVVGGRMKTTLGSPAWLRVAS